MKKFIFLLLVCNLQLLHAQVPPILTYQGRVTAGGNNFNGAGQFKFSLVNSNGTVTYWSNDGTGSGGSEPSGAFSVGVSNGLFVAALGNASLSNMTIIPAAIFTNPDVRVRIWFNDGLAGFSQLAPDQRLTSAGYAFLAGSVPDASLSPGKLSGAGAAANQAMVYNGLTAVWGNVSWSSLTGVPVGFADNVDNNTTYTAGSGLSLAGTQFSADFAGSGVASTVARSDHKHSGADITSGTLADARLSTNVVLQNTSPTFSGLKLTGGSPGAGKLLISDSNGVASWVAAPFAPRVVVVDAGGSGDFNSITGAVAAITPTAATPYVIEVRPGVYVENIQLKSHVHIHGAGMDATTVRALAGSVLFGGDLVGFNLDSVSNVIVSGLSLQGGLGGPGPAGIGLRATNSSFQVMDCRIGGFATGGGSSLFTGSGIFSHSSTGLLARVVFDNNDNYGLRLFQGDATLSACLFTGATTSQKGIRNERAVVRVTDSTFSKGWISVENLGTPSVPAFALISGNLFRGVTQALNSQMDAVFIGNRMEGCTDEAINISSGALTISGNSFSNCPVGAMIVSGGRAAITGNSFTGCGAGGGIGALTLSGDQVVAGNSFNLSPSADIAVISGEPIVSGNRLSTGLPATVLVAGQSGAGIKATGSNLVVTAAGNQSVVAGTNYSITVGRDLTANVGGNSILSAVGNQSLVAGTNFSLIVGRDLTETVAGHYVVNVTGDLSLAMRAFSLDAQRNSSILFRSNLTQTVQRDYDLTIATDMSETVGDDKTITVGGNHTETVNGNADYTFGGGLVMDVVDSLEMQVGQDLSLAVIKSMALEAGDDVLVKAGPAQTSWNKNGDTSTSGRRFVVNASGNIQMTSSSNIVLQADALTMSSGVSGATAISSTASGVGGIGLLGTATSIVTNDVHVGVMAVANNGDRNIALLANSFSAALPTPAQVPRPAAIAGRATSGEDIFQGYGAGYALRFRVSETGTVFAVSTAVQPIDLAERVPVSEAVLAGDVVEVDPDRANSFRLARGAHNPRVAGVVSTRPGMLLGHDETQPDNESRPPLALAGRVPVKVTLEGGPIRPGDLLCGSSTPGHAMKAGDQPRGGIIGTALETFADGKAVGTKIEMLVHLEAGPGSNPAELERLTAGLTEQQAKVASLERELAVQRAESEQWQRRLSRLEAAWLARAGGWDVE